MKCKAVQEQLFHYMDRESSAEESKRIRDHLLTCGECEQKYKLYQETHKALKDFGGAIRAGLVSMEAPPFPTLQRSPLWLRIRNWLEIPVPLWAPSAASIAVLLVFAVATFSPLNLSIEWGKEKGSGETEFIGPPLGDQAMLEFLIVPDPTDTGEIVASIETVEKFLKTHPEDLAMHAKLIELYQAQFKLQSFSSASRTVLTEKLSTERERFLELLKKGHLTKGDENVEK